MHSLLGIYLKRKCVNLVIVRGEEIYSTPVVGGHLFIPGCSATYPAQRGMDMKLIAVGATAARCIVQRRLCAQYTQVEELDCQVPYWGRDKT